MAELDQMIAWSVFVGLVLVARVLVSRPAQRFLGPRISRLADRWVARLRPVSAQDSELDELSVMLRRQQLSADVERLRRIVATDESMSATRQIANRIAFRGLLHDLEKTRELIPWMADDDIDDRWPSAAMAMRPSRYTYAAHRAPTAEVLEIGWRR